MVIMVDIWGSNDSDILWYVSFDRWYCTPQVKIIKESINPGYYSFTIPSGGNANHFLMSWCMKNPLQGCKAAEIYTFKLEKKDGLETHPGITSERYQPVLLCLGSMPPSIRFFSCCSEQSHLRWKSLMRRSQWQDSHFCREWMHKY